VQATATTAAISGLCLFLWPELCGFSMVWTMRLPMLASMIHLWATIRSKSFPVTNSLSLYQRSENKGVILSIVEEQKPEHQHVWSQ
jgi:hypothetical protein